MSLKNKLSELVEKYLKDTEYELVQLTYQKEGMNWVLRVLIDKNNGINLSDCSIVSKGISPILDENEDILNLVNNYSLEVSSPGVNRPLVKLDDFDRFKNNDIKVVLNEPQVEIDEKRIRYKGYLKGVKNNKIILIIDGIEILIDFELIKKANVIYNF